MLAQIGLKDRQSEDHLNSTMMRILALVLLASLARIAEASIRVQIIIDNDGSYLVESGYNRHAFSDQILGFLDWASVSYDGHNLVAYKKSCEVVRTNLSSFTPEERAVLDIFKKEHSLSHAQLNPSAGGYFKNGVYLQSFDMFTPGEVSELAARQATRSFIRMNENDFTYTRMGLHTWVGLVSVHGDMLTLVHYDGSVHMKPIECARQEELDTLAMFRKELDEATTIETANENDTIEQLLRRNEQRRRERASARDLREKRLEQERARSRRERDQRDQGRMRQLRLIMGRWGLKFGSDDQLTDS